MTGIIVVIPGTSLYRGPLHRGSTVLANRFFFLISFYGQKTVNLKNLHCKSDDLKFKKYDRSRHIQMNVTFHPNITLIVKTMNNVKTNVSKL